MKLFARSAAIAAVSVASIATGVSAAQAAPGCPTARVCFYDNYWFTGSQRTYGWVTSYVGDAANDKASSLVVGPAADPASPYVYFYRDLNYGSYAIIFRDGSAMAPGWNWDDEISSVWG